MLYNPSDPYLVLNSKQVQAPLRICPGKVRAGRAAGIGGKQRGN